MDSVGSYSNFPKKPDISQTIEVPIEIIKLPKPSINSPLNNKIIPVVKSAREKLNKNDVIFYRIEQLYPFPAKTLVKELKPFAKNAKFYWCQEEPKNMGGWFSVRDYIQWTLDNIKALILSNVHWI